jgi:hypothetical protein
MKKSWLPGWCRKMQAVFHRDDASRRSPAAVNRLLVIRAERRALREVWLREKNVEQLEAIEWRMQELVTEAKSIMGAEVSR